MSFQTGITTWESTLSSLGLKSVLRLIGDVCSEERRLFVLTPRGTQGVLFGVSRNEDRFVKCRKGPHFPERSSETVYPFECITPKTPKFCIVRKIRR